MNEFDRFIKHQLKAKYYLRYCDDFIILSNDEQYLKNLIAKISEFLEIKLKLRLHENKVDIRKLKQGIDFLGYVVLPHYTVLRTKTKKRMLKKTNETNKSSYLGLLEHCQAYELKQRVEKQIQEQICLNVKQT